jgi:hypothetical protein
MFQSKVKSVTVTLLAFAVLCVALGFVGYHATGQNERTAKQDNVQVAVPSSTQGQLHGDTDKPASTSQTEGTTETLAARIAIVLPTPEEERWLQVPWRLDLVQARAEAQRSGKPLFLWINEGHPLGCV